MNSAPAPWSSGNSILRARGKRAPAASTRSRTSGSASSVHAIATSSSSSETARSTRNPGTSASTIPTQSATDRAIGPAWSKLGASGKQPSIGTRSKVGLNPTRPHQADGIRIEPPESEPSATSARPAATAAAEPPLDPPATRPGATGFGTVPKCGFCEVTPYANSCRFVLPTFAYPASSSRRTAGALRSGTCSAKITEPYVVFSPAVSNRSLTARRTESVEPEISERDQDRAAEQQHEDPEQRQAPGEVLPRKLERGVDGWDRRPGRRRLRDGLGHVSSGSTAMATKSRAR